MPVNALPLLLAACAGLARAQPDVFTAATTDKTTAYVDEQVTLSVKFYTAVDLTEKPVYAQPKLIGFFAEDLPPERSGREVRDGRSYDFREIKTALFPAQSGSLTVGPVAVQAKLQREVSGDPFAVDFFKRVFSQGMGLARTETFSSQPVGISAVSLPERGKPEDFAGAVGSYSISASVDRREAKAGETVVLSVTVKGEGNIKALGEPRLPPLPSFRVHDTSSVVALDKANDRVRGSKVFKTALVPRVSGELILPALALPYFDPAMRAYRTARTAPIVLKIAPGAR